MIYPSVMDSDFPIHLLNPGGPEMTENIFSDKELKRLSSEMDERLKELAAGGETTEVKLFSWRPKTKDIPKKEAEVIEKTALEAGYTSENFWTKFWKSAKEDICEEGGVLNAQWRRWSDVSNEKVLEQFGKILAAMGFGGGAVSVLAFSCGVVVIHISLKVFCQEATKVETTGKDGAE
jgi:hypothetical protein